jgi:hypothetical protein
MKLIFLGLLALAVAKPKGKISFTKIEERSSNGSPSVKVNFVDGSSDFLVLSRYEGLDGHFIGHLANEKTACVAMVNHPEHTELTIMSDRTVGSTMYKWAKNGEVELIPEVFSNGETDMVMAREGEGDDEQIANEEEEANLFDIEDNMTAAEAATVPTTAKLQVQVVYDKSIKEKLGDEAAVIAYWNAAAPHLQARYCHATLGTQIKVERIGNFEYFDQKIVASGDDLGVVNSNAVQVIGSADLVVYMANDEASLWGTIGIAWSPVICSGSSSNGWKTSINEWRPQSVSFGGLLAHEIGHNLGMAHDFDDKHGGDSSACNQDNHIMSYGSSKYKWSTCSKADFEARYLQVQNNWCMEAEIGNVCGESPTPSPPSPTPTPAPTPPPSAGCGNQNWKGDNYCDDENNNAGCEYDGGDCCGDDVNTTYCSECACLATPTPSPPACNDSCGVSHWKGDNWCDDVNNNCGCDWDGGDCCGSNVNTNYCKVCACLDPAGR